MAKTKTSNITKGGLYTALSLLFIYLSNILPTNKFFILIIVSCIIPISIITTNLRNSITIYAATSLLSLLLLGIKLNVLSYIIFFGSYGFIKYYIEKINKLPIEILLKLLFANMCAVIIYLIYKLIFVVDIIAATKFPIALLMIAVEIIFLLYDYALTLFISYVGKNYLKRLK